MGKIRARTDQELAARKQDIMNAAIHQLMNEEYEEISLTTIAENTSISRTSMYTYYETKEQVYVDALIQEYHLLEQSIRKDFSEKTSRKDFCKRLAHELWSKPVLLKLLSLQLSVWNRKYDDDIIRRFVRETQSYMAALDDVLGIQFPAADKNARNMFKIQFAVYCNSLYSIEHLPPSQMETMKEHHFYEEIPSGEQICFEGLMLLSAGLEINGGNNS